MSWLDHFLSTKAFNFISITCPLNDTWRLGSWTWSAALKRCSSINSEKIWSVKSCHKIKNIKEDINFHFEASALIDHDYTYQNYRRCGWSIDQFHNTRPASALLSLMFLYRSVNIHTYATITNWVIGHMHDGDNELRDNDRTTVAATDESFVCCRFCDPKSGSRTCRIRRWCSRADDSWFMTHRASGSAAVRRIFALLLRDYYFPIQ